MFTPVNPKLEMHPELIKTLQQPAPFEQRIPYLPSQVDAGVQFGPNALQVPELPNLMPEFFLHLTAMFFTYFHPSLPVLDELRFLENLYPLMN